MGSVIRCLRLLLIGGASLAVLMTGEPALAQEARQEVLAPVTASARNGQLQSRQHTLALGAGVLHYTATMGTLPLVDDKGAATAHIFFTSYTSAQGNGSRPLLFIFNGGPGASSAFLHLGGVGPRIVPFDSQGAVAREPVHTVDNPHT